MSAKVQETVNVCWTLILNLTVTVGCKIRDQHSNAPKQKQGKQITTEKCTKVCWSMISDFAGFRYKDQSHGSAHKCEKNGRGK